MANPYLNLFEISGIFLFCLLHHLLLLLELIIDNYRIHIYTYVEKVVFTFTNFLLSLKSESFGLGANLSPKSLVIRCKEVGGDGNE